MTTIMLSLIRVLKKRVCLAFGPQAIVPTHSITKTTLPQATQSAPLKTSINICVQSSQNKKSKFSRCENLLSLFWLLYFLSKNWKPHLSVLVLPKFIRPGSIFEERLDNGALVLIGFNVYRTTWLQKIPRLID